MTSDNGATWVVTFLQTRRPTDEGMIMQGSQFDKAFVLDDPVHVELPALEVVTTPYVWRRTWDPDTDGMLAGTGAKVYVNAVYGNPIDEPWKPAVRGTSGDQAGAAYMFQRSGEGWMQTAKLVGLDTSAYNHFGASVSLTGSSDTEMFVAIGAPYAQDYGVLEVQRIVCREFDS
jgi:FG-GAP repeat